jgi:hypothetical protein
MNNSKMDLQMEAITTSLSSLAIYETEIINCSILILLYVLFNWV